MKEFVCIIFIISIVHGHSPPGISLPACFTTESGVLKGTPCNHSNPTPCDRCTRGTCTKYELSEDFCNEYCETRGFQSFGLQNRQCYCGDFDYSKNYRAINSSHCNNQCHGQPENKTHYCGGFEAVWVQPTKMITIHIVTVKSRTTLEPATTPSTYRPTTISLNQQLEVLVNQSTRLDETTLEELVRFANNLYRLSTLQSLPQDVVQIIDGILEIDDTLQNSENQTLAMNASAIIIEALDNQISRTFEKKANFTVASNDNIALKATTLDTNSIKQGLQFSATEDNSLFLEFTDEYKDSNDAIVAVTIPADVFTADTGDQKMNMSQISFVVFHRSGLFYLDGGLTTMGNDQTTIWQEVVRVKVEQIDPGMKLNNNVTYNFQNVKGECPVLTARCSYTEALSNVLREGCDTNDRGNGHVSCSCDRFGNVALLLDPVREDIGRKHTLFLHFLSVGLFSFSAILLIIITIVYLRCQKIRRRAQSKVLIGLFFSLAVFDATYIASNFPPRSEIFCRTIGVALHYFLLSSVMWMGGEVFTLYLNIVPKTKFDQDNQKFVKKIAAVCFLLPLIPVITGAVYSSFKMECVKIHQCFLLHDVIFYATLVAPVSIVLLFNVILFICILHTLHTSTRTVSSSKSKTARLRRQTRHVLTIFVLAGVTWCLAFFSLDYTGALVFNYLFTVMNGLQGIVIFILFFVFNKEIRKLMSNSQVVKSIRYGFRAPTKANVDPNVQHFRQNQQISDDPSYTIGVSATNMISM